MAECLEKESFLEPSNLVPYLKRYGFPVSADGESWQAPKQSSPSSEDTPPSASSSKLSRAFSAPSIGLNRMLGRSGTDQKTAANSDSTTEAAAELRPEEVDDDAADDCPGGPRLNFELTGHEQKDGHTLYSIDCRMMRSPKARPTVWAPKKRLAELRSGLYDEITRILDKSVYAHYFSGAPFALRGGLPGTTARLRLWLSALVNCINARACPPSCVGITLEFLNTPVLSVSGRASNVATSAADRLRGAYSSAKDNAHKRAEEAQLQASVAATTTAATFAKQNPKMAKAAGGYATQAAKQNPQLAAQATKATTSAGFGLLKQNPAAAMKVMKMSAKVGAATASNVARA